MTFLEELKRRKVVRVAIAYVVLAWLMAQVAELLLETFGAPAWVLKTLLALFLIGFPFALFFAWAFELTPDGVKRTSDADGDTAPPRHTRRSIAFVLTSLAVVALGYFLYDRAHIAPVTTAPDTQVSSPASAQDSDTISLAVLPFLNMSSDKEQEYFSDGISEELLNVLANARGIQVASRTSAFAFKGKDRNISDIARILKVDHVLEGSVRRSGDTIRITAQLIDAETDKHIWSDTYDRVLNDVFKIQDEIANKIVSALSEELGIEASRVSVNAATSDMGAYDLYLQALAAGRIFSLEGEIKRIALLREALELDPEFVDALLLLSTRLNYLPTWDAGLDNKTYNDEALYFANRALALEPDNASVHMALAEIAFRAYHFDDYDRHAETALALNPALKGELLGSLIDLGYLAQSLELAKEILSKDPAASWVNLVKSLALEGLGRKEEALEAMKDAFYSGYAGMAHILLVDDAYQRGDRVTWGTLLALDYFANYVREPDFALLRLLPELEAVVFAAEQDKDREIARYWMYAKEQGFDREDILQPYRYTTLMALREYEFMADSFWGSETKQWLWMRQLRPFRQSEPFKRKIRESGMLDYWRKNGWPELCQAVGDDDFACN